MIFAISFSVIVPTFNRLGPLRRALNSIRRQSHRAEEVIVVDDGSSDGSSRMVKSEFPEVRLFAQKNLGVSAARNLGIKKSTLPWIAFLDSDDEWLPNKLSRQVEEIEKHPELLVYHSQEIWVRNGKRVNPMDKHAKSGGWIFRRCLPRCAMSPSSIIIHRAVFEDVGEFDEALPACEDYDLWLRITSRYSVAYIDEPLIVKYGGHADQLSQKYWGMDRFRIKALQKLLDHGGLQFQDQLAARTMLLKKARIYGAGALKRHKFKEAKYYQLLRETYSMP